MVADVGGTHTRIALFDGSDGALRAERHYRNRDYNRFEDVIVAWLDALPEAAPAAGCIAVAAPHTGDRVAMVNMDWSFSCRGIAASFGFTRFRRINDFEANAFALPYLGAEDAATLHEARGNGGKLATVGPGTGLGGATLEEVAGSHHACACEPGHMGLSASSPEELELFSLLLPRHGDLYAELLLSGPGLQRLYLALAEIRDDRVDALPAPAISARAVAGEDPLCERALHTFCALLGSTCGDFLLANGAYGGLYLAGGILPQIIPFLRGSAFHQRLVAKGAMRDQLDAVPVAVITRPAPALLGAAHAPLG
jgi:glucokinase